MSDGTPTAGETPDYGTMLEEARRRVRALLAEAESSGLQPTAWRGESQGRISQLQDELAELERALAKLDAGSYGVCERCHAAIPVERLEFNPAGRYCVRCAA